MGYAVKLQKGGRLPDFILQNIDHNGEFFMRNIGYKYLDAYNGGGGSSYLYVDSYEVSSWPTTVSTVISYGSFIRTVAGLGSGNYAYDQYIGDLELIRFGGYNRTTRIIAYLLLHN